MTANKEVKEKNTGTRREPSMLTKLQKFVPRRVALFIIWNFSPENQRQDFQDWSNKNIGGVSLDCCMEYFLRKDAQDAVKFYMQETRTYELMKIYYEMIKKANTGDVNAAKWVESFCSNKEFFDKDKSEHEIEKFMNKVNIPALKKVGVSNGDK